MKAATMEKDDYHNTAVGGREGVDTSPPTPHDKDVLEESAPKPGTPIRHSQSLCAGEQDYVNKRKEKVLESLHGLGINCTADAVPHIALLASGGGERAAMGSLGSLHQMGKDGLLDTFLYIGGVSGSTWSMSFLYSDPHWSTDMDTAITRLSNSEVELGEAVAWLVDKAEDEDFSLTHFWGLLTSARIMKQLDLRRLSDEADRNVTNPYPIYCAIERECFDNGTFEGQWFEVSPHEVGFTELGVFIETSLLGSKFNGGELLERTDEMDMVELQGILGSAFADLKTIKETIYSWLSNKIMSIYHSVGLLSSAQQYSLLQRFSFIQFCIKVPWLIYKVMSLMKKWEWGTTANFLYQYQASGIPSCLHSKEILHLIDAGLLMNVPYPPFLGDKRDIDLIIAPDYSAGKMFETLTLARDYAKMSKTPFPEIDEKILEDREWPKDCYVFEGKEKEPTIIYMPLFNRKNCKDAEEFKAQMNKFSTFHLPYTQDMIDDLLKMARDNVANNKETLLEEIRKAALRKQSRKGAGDEPEATTVKV